MRFKPDEQTPFLWIKQTSLLTAGLAYKGMGMLNIERKLGHNTRLFGYEFFDEMLGFRIDEEDVERLPRSLEIGANGGLGRYYRLQEGYKEDSAIMDVIRHSIINNIN